MRLKLKELKQVVDNTLAEEKSVDALREEVTRVLGPAVDTDVKLRRLAEGANDRIDVLERTGRAGRLDFKPAVLLKFANNADPEVRRFVARVLPENFISRFKLDRDPAVRHAVARRLPLTIVREMLNRDISDDELRTIYHEKKLNESAEADLKKSQKHYEALNSSAAQTPEPELSEQWYISTAHKAISDYNHNLEGQWDEPWVHRYCASLRTTSGIQVDENKLWKEIQKQLKDRDDRTLERHSLKEVARRLRENFDYEEPSLHIETVDPVRKLLESGVSAVEYVRQAKQVFNIRESIMPVSLKKYMVSEGRTTEIMIPCTGRVPGRRTMTQLDERALDSFVKKWNEVQHQRGEPVRINWAHNPTGPGMITFKAELK